MSSFTHLDTDPHKEIEYMSVETVRPHGCPSWKLQPAIIVLPKAYAPRLASFM